MKPIEQAGILVVAQRGRLFATPHRELKA